MAVSVFRHLNLLSSLVFSWHDWAEQLLWRAGAPGLAPFPGFSRNGSRFCPARREKPLRFLTHNQQPVWTLSRLIAGYKIESFNQFNSQWNRWRTRQGSSSLFFSLCDLCLAVETIPAGIKIKKKKQEKKPLTHVRGFCLFNRHVIALNLLAYFSHLLTF